MLRLAIVTMVLWVCAVVPRPVSGQDARDVGATIRSFEVNESVAMLRADVATLDRIWSDDLRVTDPWSEVLTKEQALASVRSGAIAYSVFERYVDDLFEYGETVLVIGSEAAIPVGDGPDAGRLVDRRFTHVWFRTPDGWRLVGRHASGVVR